MWRGARAGLTLRQGELLFPQSPWDWAPTRDSGIVASSAFTWSGRAMLAHCRTLTQLLQTTVFSLLNYGHYCLRPCPDLSQDKLVFINLIRLYGLS